MHSDRYLHLSYDVTLGDLDKLLARAKAGDSQAEDMLYLFLFDWYIIIGRRRLYNPDDIEDVAQDACLTFLNKYKTATFKKGFEPWARKILENKIMNYNKKVKTRKRRLSLLIANLILHNPPPNLVLREIENCLAKIKARNPRYEQVLTLRGQGFKNREISKQLKISYSNCCTILSRGRIMLRKCLDQAGYKSC